MAHKGYIACFQYNFRKNMFYIPNFLQVAGLVFEVRGVHQEALKSFRKALDIEPNHVRSLISTACVLRKLGGQSSSIVRSPSTHRCAKRVQRKEKVCYYLGL